MEKMTPMHEFQPYFNKLGQALALMEATEADCPSNDAAWMVKGEGARIQNPLERVIGWLWPSYPFASKVIVIGNGGSAAIASHVANDFNTIGIRAMALNDASALTCLSNDFGYHLVFAKQIEWHGYSRDVLIAISSSGESLNIVCAVEAAVRTGMQVVTLSGFAPDNHLRRLGHLNFYVPSSEYGFVEMAHHVILHAVTDALIEKVE